MTDKDQKLKEFFALPALDRDPYNPFNLQNEGQPLNPNPIAGDDIFVAVDKNGIAWSLTTDGAARYPL